MSRSSTASLHLSRWWVVLLVTVLMVWRGTAVSADGGPSEVFLKLSEDKTAGAFGCVEMRAWMASYDPRLTTSDCRSMPGSPRTFRMRWATMSPALLDQWLSEQRQAGHIEWFELPLGGMKVQASLATNYYANLSAAMAVAGTPAFVADVSLRLQNLLRIYRPAGLVTVAVIDSGVNFDGKPVDSLKALNTSEVPDNGIDDDSNGYVDDIAGWDFVDEGVNSWGDDTRDPDNDPQDLLGHGTAVARIAVATVGLDAATWLRILPLRVASGTNGVGSVSPFALAEAIHYATSMGVHVINLSVGSVQSYQVVTEAIDAALTQGVQVVVAAGNSSGGVLFPANLPGVLAVGALDGNGQIWSGSARGPEVALFLRGTDMLSELGGGFAGLAPNGTSYAAPVATAMAAMLWAVTGDCAAAGQTIRQFRPADQRAETWAAALVNQFESDAQGGGNLPGRWEAGEGVCGSDLTVAALLRSAAL